MRAVSVFVLLLILLLPAVGVSRGIPQSQGAGYPQITTAQLGDVYDYDNREVPLTGWTAVHKKYVPNPYIPWPDYIFSAEDGSYGIATTTGYHGICWDNDAGKSINTGRNFDGLDEITVYLTFYVEGTEDNLDAKYSDSPRILLNEENSWEIGAYAYTDVSTLYIAIDTTTTTWYWITIGNVSNGVWHKLVWRYSALKGYFEIWVDGEKIMTKDYSGTISSAGYTLWLFNRSVYGPAVFGGRIDDVVIWRTWLLDTALNALWNTLFYYSPEAGRELFRNYFDEGTWGWYDYGDYRRLWYPQTSDVVFQDWEWSNITVIIISQKYDADPLRITLANLEWDVYIRVKGLQSSDEMYYNKTASPWYGLWTKKWYAGGFYHFNGTVYTYWKQYDFTNISYTTKTFIKAELYFPNCSWVVVYRGQLSEPFVELQDDASATLYYDAVGTPIVPDAWTGQVYTKIVTIENGFGKWIHVNITTTKNTTVVAVGPYTTKQLALAMAEYWTNITNYWFHLLDDYGLLVSTYRLYISFYNLWTGLGLAYNTFITYVNGKRVFYPEIPLATRVANVLVYDYFGRLLYNNSIVLNESETYVGIGIYITTLAINNLANYSVRVNITFAGKTMSLDLGPSMSWILSLVSDKYNVTIERKLDNGTYIPLCNATEVDLSNVATATLVIRSELAEVVTPIENYTIYNNLYQILRQKEEVEYIKWATYGLLSGLASAVVFYAFWWVLQRRKKRIYVVKVSPF